MLGVREGVPVYLERSGNVSDKVNSDRRQGGKGAVWESRGRVVQADGIARTKGSLAPLD